MTPPPHFFPIDSKNWRMRRSRYLSGPRPLLLKTRNGRRHLGIESRRAHRMMYWAAFLSPNKNDSNFHQDMTKMSLCWIVTGRHHGRDDHKLVAIFRFFRF
ncbi:hypothetical protein MTP99_000466 [Tenebrio molitor]|nr:hypothetical protein MTP99_000466 [Tenebrio molitor]